MGKTVRVVASNNPTQQGLQGEIVDETLKTLCLSIGGERKVLFKVGLVLEELDSGKKISGLDRRAEDRLKG